MQKLILVQWDMRLGPNALVQFPPEEKFPPKELLLKIWARHETNSTSNFISFAEPTEKKKYCSLLKYDTSKNYTFFILLELSPEVDERIYQEILENVSNDLIINYGKPHFSHVLSETYRAIRNYSELDSYQLFFRVFDDVIRMKILEYLRKGVMSKSSLRNRLRQNFGYSKLNLDLLLTPFLRLGLIKIMDVQGTPDSIFLIWDIFASRVPPPYRPNSQAVVDSIKNLFESNQILKSEYIHKLLHLYESPHTVELLKLIKMKKERGIPIDIAMELVKDNKKLITDLEENQIIFNLNGEHLYILSIIHFEKFSPTYLVPILQKRYNEGEISINQLIQHLKLLELTDIP